MAELKEDGQVSCDAAQNLRLTCSYITPHARATAAPASASSTSLAFSCSISVKTIRSFFGQLLGRVLGQLLGFAAAEQAHGLAKRLG